MGSQPVKRKGGNSMPPSRAVGSGARVEIWSSCWHLERTGPGRPGSDLREVLRDPQFPPPSPRSSPPDLGPGGLSSPEAKVTSVCLSCLKAGIFYQTQRLVPFKVGAEDSRGVRVKGDDPGG